MLKMLMLLNLFVLLGQLSTAHALDAFNALYTESIHIRKNEKGIIAPKTVYIQPATYSNYQISLEYNDDFEKINSDQESWWNRFKSYLPNSDSFVNGKISCDQPVRLKKTKYFLSATSGYAKEFSFKVYKTKPGKPRLFILPSKTVNQCKIEVGSASIQLVSNQESEKYLTELLNQPSQCDQLVSDQPNPYLNTFNALNTKQTTCAYPIHEVLNLDQKIDGVQGKMEALLGQPLSADFLKQKNPYAKLDFSKAPKLDAILVSYLVMRADFSGVLLSRALLFHARRGTQVRILVSNVISITKDKALFDRLTASSPNIKVQLYQWNRVKNAGKGNITSSLHRVLHTKLFITLSKTNPSLNRLIHGGRNIHDGFIFDEPIHSASASPYVNYGTDESWSSWRDFEMEIRDTPFINAVAKHYLLLWNRDAKSNRIPDYIKYKGAVKNISRDQSATYIKHFVSVPFQDGYYLQKLYANLIDTAQKEIVITSPYLRPPKMVMEALDRAVKRNVRVKIITRVHLEGDTADKLLEEVNKASINKMYKKVDLYEYTADKEILHSKLLVIDSTLSLVSSVNMNHRSYIQDFEDGILMLGEDNAKKLLAVIDSYGNTIKRVTSPVKKVWWRKVVVDVFKNAF